MLPFGSKLFSPPTKAEPSRLLDRLVIRFGGSGISSELVLTGGGGGGAIRGLCFGEACLPLNDFLEGEGDGVELRDMGLVGLSQEEGSALETIASSG